MFTDGQANQGITDRAALMRMIEEGIASIPGTIKLVMLGYGQDCDSDLLQTIATHVEGSYHFLQTAEDIPAAIGEEFGTAFETRQQNCTIAVPPTAAVVQGHTTTADGCVRAGDLLAQEKKTFLFKVVDAAAFNETTFVVTYLDCETGVTHRLDISGRESVENESGVCDAVNVRACAEALQAAALLPQGERCLRLEACLAHLAASATRDSAVTQRLLKTLRETIARLDIMPPASLRSCSASTQNQRGGHFSLPSVGLYRSLTEGGVSENMQQQQQQQQQQGATTAPSPLPRPTLQRC